MRPLSPDFVSYFAAHDTLRSSGPSGVDGVSASKPEDGTFRLGCADPMILSLIIIHPFSKEAGWWLFASRCRSDLHN